MVREAAAGTRAGPASPPPANIKTNVRPWACPRMTREEMRNLGTRRRRASTADGMPMGQVQGRSSLSWITERLNNASFCILDLRSLNRAERCLDENFSAHVLGMRGGVRSLKNQAHGRTRPHDACIHRTRLKSREHSSKPRHIS